MSLRERKRKTTRESILAGARSLFFKNGYRSTSMEMIAEASDVAVGTIYNYFRSKAEVMVAINQADSDGVLLQLDRTMMEQEPVEDLLWAVIEKILLSLESYPRELIRELFTAAFDKPRSRLSSGLVSQDERFISYLTDLLAGLKSFGRLKGETVPETVAFSIYSLTFSAIMWYTMDEILTIEDAKVMIAGMIGQFCRGILPEGG